MVLRLIKILVAWAFGAFAALVCISNFQEASINLGYIQTVISMVDVFPTSPRSRAFLPLESISTLLSIIVALDGLIAFLLIIGGLRMLINIQGPALQFNRSKSVASFGYCVAFLLWFVGFVTIAGEWFLAWQYPMGKGAIDISFNISMVALLGLIFLNQKDDEVT
ncbi:hypothetical protein PsAD2_00098 [Pseudovibrio axinellae]|uniref:Small integral membrane protein n=1 Tax=Pseudovibrio axinellae TaxID=989403 RepID=A0A166BAP5_9HYPH|nr:DUF2165 domain-containing protein [Pseudovibrio axinellae]KZL22073.1 hypothetical protein PsAD2_00098 [Pseudovibrio axinellae]SEQ56321.1 Predicted small integral membrane protein [Pseudovibrio axinellae]